MTWAQRLKRVFSIDIEVCGRCGGSVRVIACIEDQNIIDRILAHLRDREQDIPTLLPLLTPPPRAPPETLPLYAEQLAKDAFSNGGVELHRKMTRVWSDPLELDQVPP